MRDTSSGATLGDSVQFPPLLLSGWYARQIPPPRRAKIILGLSEIRTRRTQVRLPHLRNHLLPSVWIHLYLVQNMERACKYKSSKDVNNQIQRINATPFSEPLQTSGAFLIAPRNAESSFKVRPGLRGHLSKESPCILARLIFLNACSENSIGFLSTPTVFARAGISASDHNSGNWIPWVCKTHREMPNR